MGLHLACSVSYDIDNDGNARICDVKSVRNSGTDQVTLGVEFTQSVHKDAWDFNVTDSNDIVYEVHRDVHSDLGYMIAKIPLTDKFTVRPGETRSLKIGYQAPQFLKKLEKGTTAIQYISSRFGGVPPGSYDFSFDSATFEVSYSIKRASIGRLKRWFGIQSVLLAYPSSVVVDHDKQDFTASCRFSMPSIHHVQQIDLVLLRQPKRWPAALGGAIGAIAANVLRVLITK